jgi:hypothetical protein
MNPYIGLPGKNFWKTFINSNFDLGEINNSYVKSSFTLTRIASAGSCFAANIIPFIKKTNVEYVMEEPTHSFLAKGNLKYNYDTYSAKYGNIYTPRQLKQLLMRALGEFDPTDKFWKTEIGYIDAYRPGLAYKPKSIKDIEFITNHHLKAVIRAIQKADTFIFTLGLSETWQNSRDGAIYPVCPGTVAGEYNSKFHEFKNFSTNELSQDLEDAYKLVKRINNKIKMVITVSPVPMLATYTNNNVVVANAQSKSKLIVAAHEFVSDKLDVDYFPAYEMVIGPYVKNAFENDNRTVTQQYIEKVMNEFKKRYTIQDYDFVDNEVDSSREIRKLLDRECEESAYEKYI